MENEILTTDDETFDYGKVICDYMGIAVYYGTREYKCSDGHIEQVTLFLDSGEDPSVTAFNGRRVFILSWDDIIKLAEAAGLFK